MNIVRPRLLFLVLAIMGYAWIGVPQQAHAATKQYERMQAEEARRNKSYELEPLAQILNDLNHIKPEQNPEFTSGRRLIGRNILDSRNKVIGEVNDVILNPQGRMIALEADMRRLQLSRTVYLDRNATGLSGRLKTYALPQNGDIIADNFKGKTTKTLNDIETSAGGSSPGNDSPNQALVSLSRLTQSKIMVTGQIQPWGRVMDVLFEPNGERAEAIIIELRTGKARGKTIALPFDKIAITNGTQPILNVSPETAAAAARYLGV